MPAMEERPRNTAYGLLCPAARLLPPAATDMGATALAGERLDTWSLGVRDLISYTQHLIWINVNDEYPELTLLLFQRYCARP